MATYGYQVQVTSATTTISNNTSIVWDTSALVDLSGEAITHSGNTITITTGGAGKYIVNWWVAVQTQIASEGSLFKLDVTGTTTTPSTYYGYDPTKIGACSGIALIEVGASTVTLKLTNVSGIDVAYGGYHSYVKASLSIAQIGVGIIGPTGYTGPTGTSIISGLYIQTATGGSAGYNIANGAAIPFTGPAGNINRAIGAGVSFSSPSTITVSTAGIYLFQWGLNAENTSKVVVVSLVDVTSGGTTVIASSGVMNSYSDGCYIGGSTIYEFGVGLSYPRSIQLLNRSNNAIILYTAIGTDEWSNSMTVVQLK